MRLWIFRVIRNFAQTFTRKWSRMKWGDYWRLNFVFVLKGTSKAVSQFYKVRLGKLVAPTRLNMMTRTYPWWKKITPRYPLLLSDLKWAVLIDTSSVQISSVILGDGNSWSRTAFLICLPQTRQIKRLIKSRNNNSTMHMWYLQMETTWEEHTVLKSSKLLRISQVIDRT